MLDNVNPDQLASNQLIWIYIVWKKNGIGLQKKLCVCVLPRLYSYESFYFLLSSILFHRRCPVGKQCASRSGSLKLADQDPHCLPCSFCYVAWFGWYDGDLFSHAKNSKWLLFVLAFEKTTSIYQVRPNKKISELRVSLKILGRVGTQNFC